MYGPGWDERFAAVPRDGVPTVLLVGGSTAEGFAPEILEAALRQVFHRPVRVVNGAFGGYEARQEAVVASIWGPSLRPSAIVSLDGQNDLEHRLRVPAPGRFFLDGSYRTYLTRPLLAPLAWILSQSQAYNGLVRVRARRNVGEWTAYATRFPSMRARSIRSTSSARGLGAARLMVLQPFASFRIRSRPKSAPSRPTPTVTARCGRSTTTPPRSSICRAPIRSVSSTRGRSTRACRPRSSPTIHFQAHRATKRWHGPSRALPADTFERRP